MELNLFAHRPHQSQTLGHKSTAQNQNRDSTIPPTSHYEQLQQIISGRLLSAHFQAIIQMQDGQILGYEGLIRGPSDTALHSPINLFQAAREHGLSVTVEHLCRRVVLEQFKELDLPGKLFLNVSPECLLQSDARLGETLDYIHELGINPNRVIIELTEYQPTHDYQLLRTAVMHYRNMGFEIAIDDLGEGFSSLRLWSELKPEFVKIDMHFIQGIDHDLIKRQFVRSIQSIATQSGTKVVAEGIETQAELVVIRELGITCGQGYHIAKPHMRPAKTISAEVTRLLSQGARPMTKNSNSGTEKPRIRSLMKTPVTIHPGTINSDVEDLFLADPSLKLIPVIEQGRPLGVVNRYNMVAHLSRPFQRELYGKKACTVFMDSNALIVDHNTSLQEVSHMVVEADPDHLLHGILITENERYLGVATGPDLMREITRMQIDAARYANPLTQLPGNVPINQQIDQLIQQQISFVVCYCDLDHFKPFNDIYGYQRGDEVIQMTSQLIAKHCLPPHDFVGHIGGDDFIILFQNNDWEQRCRAILEEFSESINSFYSREDQERGGYLSEDRQGKKVFYPLICLSLGAIQISAQNFDSHHQVAVAASEAKKQAKRIVGNSLFIDRRRR